MIVPPPPAERRVRYLPVWEIRLRLWHWSNLVVVLLLFESYLLFDWHKELGLSRSTTALFQKAHIYLGYAFILERVMEGVMQRLEKRKWPEPPLDR